MPERQLDPLSLRPSVRGPVGRSLLVLAVLATAGCLFPTDRSSELAVELDLLPTLFLKDSLQISARVVDQAGAAVPNAIVMFSSSDPTVISVDPGGRLLAVGVGTATITATAVGFADAVPATAAAQVRGLIEIDSVLPSMAAFGDTLRIFGVGLNPDSAFNPFLSITLGGVEAEVADFAAQDLSKPNRLGQLAVWVPPPAVRRSTLTVLGFNGGVLFPDSVEVLQRDVYEPNDTSASDLGNIPVFFRNPALAFEPRPRLEVRQPADWYRFTNPQTQDRTVVVFSEDVGAETFSVFISDSLGWLGGLETFFVGSQAWTFGPESHLCDGLVVTAGAEEVLFAELRFPFAVMALADLPAGTYDLLVPYVAPAEPEPYEVLIANGYFSSEPRDVAEENDYCDVAAPIGVTAGQKLTIDNPHDIDWYSFTVAGGPSTVSFTATATSPGAVNQFDPDLDLYLIRDDRPTALTLIGVATAEGPSDVVGTVLPDGDYFLVVVDFVGRPTEYQLNSVFAAAPAGAVAAVSPPEEVLRQFRRKKARALTAPAAGQLSPLRATPRE